MEYRETAWLRTPVGVLALEAGEQGLCAVRVARGTEPEPHGGACPLLREACRQLTAYFAGELRAFDLPVELHSTAFEQAVWRQLRAIAYGETASYGQIAAQLGKPKASRAVGGACSRNPLLIVVPCHRVVAASGRLTGFAAGLAVKRDLLALEGWSIDEGRLRMKRG